MKIRTVFPLFFVLLAAGALQAKPVSPATALAVAQKALNRSDLKEVTPSEVSQYYIFVGSNGQGFAIVAGEDLSVPLLGYSTTSAFSVDNMAPATEYWLATYARQIDNMRREGGTPSAVVTRAWAEGRMPRSTAKEATLADSVPYLLSTTWNQSPYYNDLCPYDNYYNDRAVTGCGATAMGQVMKYWNHPTTGFGSHFYYDETYGFLEANFDTTVYQWDSMPNALTAVSSPAQVLAVATLMKDIGVAIEMGYGVAAVGGSWSYVYGYPSIEDAFNRYYKYRTTVHHLNRWCLTDAEWEYYLKVDLSAGRPIVYRAADDTSGGGHIFVCDGYDAYGAFHFNWGWGGFADGYYYMGALNVETYYAFNSGHVAVLGIEPDTAFSSTAPVSITPVTNSLSYGYVSGDSVYSYGDEVSLLATAAPGYRFDRWADGVVDNPRYFRATGDRTDSAIFVPITGDTISFSNGCHYTSFGYSDMVDTYWGVKFPPVYFDSNHVITAIQTILTSGEDYDIVYHYSIYSGGDDHPQTLLYADSVVVNQYGWVTIPLDSAVHFDQSAPLWITFHGAGPYVICVSTYSGNPESFYWNTNDGAPDGWNSMFDLGWEPWTVVLRAVMSHGLPMCTVTTDVNDSTMGTVSAGGIYEKGTLVTITAMPNANYRFSHWNDDTTLTANPYTFTLTGSRNLVANFERIQYSVSLSVNDTTLGHVTGGGIYDSGSEVLVEAMQSDGARFLRWSDGVTEARRHILLTQDTALTAYFELDTTGAEGILVVDAAEMGVALEGRTICVNSEVPVVPLIIDAVGRQLATGCRFTVPVAGVYIVRMGNQICKLVVL